MTSYSAFFSSDVERGINICKNTKDYFPVSFQCANNTMGLFSISPWESKHDASWTSKPKYFNAGLERQPRFVTSGHCELNVSCLATAPSWAMLQGTCWLKVTFSAKAECLPPSGTVSSEEYLIDLMHRILSNVEFMSHAKSRWGTGTLVPVYSARIL